jgi:8-oxo-dGTP pyrophosphatase MutT (NUDIX family)
VTEQALRPSAADVPLRDLIEQRLRRDAGNGDPDAAIIAGLASTNATAQELRQYLPKTWSRAAVLVPLVERSDGLTVLFTQRSAQLTNHPGQVSFPGGRIEATDAGAWEAAVREVEEEIGLSRERIRRAGYLPDHLVISGFVVTPVVGYVTPDFDLRLDLTEVDDTFEVPLEFLLDRTNHVPITRRIGGRSFAGWDIPWQGRRIWGATAGMVLSFVNLLDGA